MLRSLLMIRVMTLTPQPLVMKHHFCIYTNNPNPTSGFIVLVPKKDIRPISLTTEEALRWVISLGIINPRDHDDD